MAPHVFASLVTRNDFPQDNGASLSPTIIAGIIVAAVIAVGASIWLGIRWYRKRATAARKERRASAFASYMGAGNMTEKYSPASALPLKGQFSRDQLNHAVVMPERAVLRPGASRDEILEHYTLEGKLPRPFAPFAPPPLDDSDLVPPQPGRLPSGRPASNASWLPPAFPLASSRDSRRMSAISTVSSVFSTQSGATHQKVRQIFDPVLPDELVVSLGETLTMVQTYDDGWCIVGRDSVFKPGEVELGAVPSWCFVKPIKGLRAERPMRVSSLGVTINLDAGPGVDSRDNVMSWSNF